MIKNNLMIWLENKFYKRKVFKILWKKSSYIFFIFLRKLFSFLPYNLNPLVNKSGRVKISRYIKKINDLGITIEIDPNQYLDKNYLYNLYDKKSINFLIKKSSNCELFFDVGANLGIYGFALAKAHPHLTSVLIEPDPYSIERIQRNLVLNNSFSSRVKFINCGVGINNRGLDLMLNTSGNRGGSSVCIDQRYWTKNNEN